MHDILRIRKQIRFLFTQLECIKSKGCLCFAEKPELSFDKNTKTLTSKYSSGETASETLPFAYPEDFDQVQSDFNQTDSAKIDFIKNKPTVLSDFNNDSGFITISDIPEYTYNIENDNIVIKKDSAEIAKLDLSEYLDDTNSPRISSGVLNAVTKQVLFTRNDGSNFYVDLSALAVNKDPVTNLTNTPSPTGVSINSSNGTDTVIPLVNETNAGLQKPDFYESGTYVPQAFNSNGDKEYTATTAVGNYSRVAGMVQFDLLISGLTNPSDTSGSFYVTLPFSNPFTNSRPITYIINFITGPSGTVIPTDKNFRTGTMSGNKLFFYWDGLPAALDNVSFDSTKVTQIEINGIFQTSYTP